MPIPLKEDANLSDLVQRPYNLSPRDKKAMDDLINPLRDIGVIEDAPFGEACLSRIRRLEEWKTAACGRSATSESGDRRTRIPIAHSGQRTVNYAGCGSLLSG